MDKYAVIGLGKFGMTVASNLYKNGAEVVAIDKNQKLLDEAKSMVSLTIKMDSTDESALMQAGITSFDAVILGVGDDIETSILTCTILKKLGVSNIYAKVESKIHEKILGLIGIKNTYFPEEQIGIQLSQFLRSNNIISYKNLANNLSLIELLSPDSFVGKSLQQLSLTKKGITVVAIQSERFAIDEEGQNMIENEINRMPGANDIIESGNVLILLGTEVAINNLLEDSRN